MLVLFWLCRAALQGILYLGRNQWQQDKQHTPRECFPQTEEAKCLLGPCHERYCSGNNEQTKSLIYTDGKQQTVTERTELLEKPRRKDTPYHLDLPLFPGVTQMKKQEGSSFLEEEEENAEDEECDHWIHIRPFFLLRIRTITADYFVIIWTRIGRYLSLSNVAGGFYMRDFFHEL